VRVSLAVEAEIENRNWKIEMGKAYFAGFESSGTVVEILRHGHLCDCSLRRLGVPHDDNYLRCHPRRGELQAAGGHQVRGIHSSYKK
jgi:hypothetical protein